MVKHQEAPGTTFKRHLKIARGVLGEDDTLLREILYNPLTINQITHIRTQLKELSTLIENKDESGFNRYLTRIRGNIK